MAPAPKFNTGDIVMCVQDVDAFVKAGNTYIVADSTPCWTHLVNPMKGYTRTGGYYPKRFVLAAHSQVADEYEEIMAAQEVVAAMDKTQS